MSVVRDVETRGDEDAGRYDLLAQYGGQPHMMKRIGELYLSRRHHVFWTHIMSDSHHPCWFFSTLGVFIDIDNHEW